MLLPIQLKTDRHTDRQGQKHHDPCSFNMGEGLKNINMYLSYAENIEQYII
jgi:hypothetical protein